MSSISEGEQFTLEYRYFLLTLYFSVELWLVICFCNRKQLRSIILHNRYRQGGNIYIYGPSALDFLVQKSLILVRIKEAHLYVSIILCRKRNVWKVFYKSKSKLLTTWMCCKSIPRRFVLMINKSLLAIGHSIIFPNTDPLI